MGTNPLHPDLRQWFEQAQRDDNSLHVSICYRNKKDQTSAFLAIPKKSNAKFGQSPHNYIPVLGIDVFFLIDGKGNWDVSKMKDLAETLPDELMWGGDFKSFKDSDHFEVKDWKSLAKNYPNGS